MKKTEARRVGDIIAEIIDGGDSRPEFDRQKACWVWGELLGPSVVRVTARRFVLDDTLHVYITSPAIKNELMFMTDALVGRINSAVGAPVIKKIIIH